jgi:hypothetical protein
MRFRSSSILLSGLALLFVIGEPAWADSSHARVIRLSLVQGEVRFTRDFHHDPLADQKAVWENAALNLPIRQGYALATDNGRAEVEFENGAMAFLAENTVLEFYDLSLNDGAKTTRLILRQGTGSFYVNPSSDDYFSVTGGDFTIEANSRANFRLDNFDDGSVVNVSKGHVSVARKGHTTQLAKDQSFSIRANDDESAGVARASDPDDFDRWVSGREDTVQTATNAAQRYVNSPYYTPGVADLYTYGSWYNVSGYGSCWRPYGVGFGWSPFDNGGWFMDPFFGWTFIGYQPWGWLPYHYGGWLFDPVFGWLWSPFGFGSVGFGGGFIPFRPVTGVFVRSRTGLLGLVPAHPLDVRGKAPINLTRGVMPVTGGSVSTQVATVDTPKNWKVLKNAPREALVNNATVTATAPARVSRTIIAGDPAGRANASGRNSSIVYDPQERRFVNRNAAPTSNTLPGAERTQTSTQVQAPNTDRSATRGAATSQTGAAGARATTAPPASRTSAPPGATRAATPPPARNMTPPPAPRSSAGTGRSSQPSWSGAGSSAGARSSAPASGPAARPAPAPRSSSTGGRPASSGRPH